MMARPGPGRPTGARVWPHVLVALAASLLLHIGVAMAIVGVWDGAEPQSRTGTAMTVSLSSGVPGGGDGARAGGAPETAASPDPETAGTASAPEADAPAPEPAKAATAAKADATHPRTARPSVPDAAAAETPSVPDAGTTDPPKVATAGTAQPLPPKPEAKPARKPAPNRMAAETAKTAEPPPKPRAKPAPPEAARAARAKASPKPQRVAAAEAAGSGAKPESAKTEPAPDDTAPTDARAPDGGPDTAKAAGAGAGEPAAAREGAGGGGRSATPLSPEAGNPAPSYPRAARRRGWEGQVVLAVTVTKDGDAASLRVVESSGHAVLDRAAKKAVRDWRFRPAERLGEPVRDRIRVPIRFALKQG